MAQVDGGEPVAVPIPASSHPDAPIDVFIDSGAQWRASPTPSMRCASRTAPDRHRVVRGEQPAPAGWQGGVRNACRKRRKIQTPAK